MAGVDQGCLGSPDQKGVVGGAVAQAKFDVEAAAVPVEGADCGGVCGYRLALEAQARAWELRVWVGAGHDTPSGTLTVGRTGAGLAQKSPAAWPGSDSRVSALQRFGSAFDLHLHGGEGLGFGGAHREEAVAVVGLDGIAVDASGEAEAAAPGAVAELTEQGAGVAGGGLGLGIGAFGTDH